MMEKYLTNPNALKEYEFDITVLVIATNKYFGFIPTLLSSIEEHFPSEFRIQILLFTDENNFYTAVNSKSDRLKIERVLIPSYGWPEATLLRYEIFENNFAIFKGKLTIYMDADTVVVKDIPIEKFDSSNWNNGIALVEHPGYFNRNFIFRLLFKFSIVGPWEGRKSSQGFVPFFKRKKYVCGGVWMGKTSEIKKMILMLANQVEVDTKNNFLAKWHDESHLNKFFSENQVSTLTPEWAYAAGYKNLKGISPLIQVIHKDNEFNLSKSN